MNDENVGLDKINDERPINNSYQLSNADNHERSFLIMNDRSNHQSYVTRVLLKSLTRP